MFLNDNSRKMKEMTKVFANSAFIDEKGVTKRVFYNL